VNPQVRSNYLASPPLVVAYAIAGRIDIDLSTEPLGTGKDGVPVYLGDVWPTVAEINLVLDKYVTAAQFEKEYSRVFEGDTMWRSVKTPAGDTFAWDEASTYVKYRRTSNRCATRRLRFRTGRPARAGDARGFDHDRSHFTGR